MTSKKSTKKAKAPEVVYVEICNEGNVSYVSTDPEEIEDARDDGNRIARYKFDGFVVVETKTVVTDVEA